MYLTKKFEFDSAHHLVNYKGKCERVHGHTYGLSVTLEGTPGDDGLVMDFVELKSIVHAHVLDHLDHTDINERIAQPTAENIARWIWQQLDLPLRRPNAHLYEIEVWETRDSGVRYRGD